MNRVAEIDKELQRIDRLANAVSTVIVYFNLDTDFETKLAEHLHQLSKDYRQKLDEKEILLNYQTHRLRVEFENEEARYETMSEGV